MPTNCAGALFINDGFWKCRPRHMTRDTSSAQLQDPGQACSSCAPFVHAYARGFTPRSMTTPTLPARVRLLQAEYV